MALEYTSKSGTGDHFTDVITQYAGRHFSYPCGTKLPNLTLDLGNSIASYLGDIIEVTSLDLKVRSWLFELLVI